MITPPNPSDDGSGTAVWIVNTVLVGMVRVGGPLPATEKTSTSNRTPMILIGPKSVKSPASSEDNSTVLLARFLRWVVVRIDCGKLGFDSGQIGVELGREVLSFVRLLQGKVVLFADVVGEVE